ncbi:glycoside hydrolase family 3 protein [Aaosphaeria arxii CBS 175.79]|uniref:beta-glucosidase n=1 Tax=Aaosphaeria arxii CBS 175.79 TaxID=1450172 RepID=A0A6A5X6F8_9PLEO|nr:glycoside hydrolase family 3 protein [Aaosphaeria arxii CBS 175.79]KAF2008490.1 glycoside hydrolase family 3 protein [Aaosphaeria arxii CBS 175.79]
MAQNSVFDSTIDVDEIISQLTLNEKIQLLAGKDTFSVSDIARLGIPALKTADGPHGIRGTRSFESYPSHLLPSASSMGATFDPELMEKVGNLLGDEARNKGIHVLLAPTVCLQRSPLLGRGFEAFGEDPVLSGTMAASYIRGLQDRRVAACIKHYAAHDQSPKGIEDNEWMSQRTLRELHLAPFQIALKLSRPWAIMTAYQKINNVHASEDPILLKEILREEWQFDGLVMSDWWGTYSTSQAINAGLDLEMPGPSVFRGRALGWAVASRKVSELTIDRSVRNHLNLLKKVQPSEPIPPSNPGAANTPENRALIRRLAADGIVLLKNEKNILPLKLEGKKSYGLIGHHWVNPSLGGGGSAEVEPYYVVTPYDAMAEVVGRENITYTIGAYSFRNSPFLKNLTLPNSSDPGWLVEIFGENPTDNSEATPLMTVVTKHNLIDVPESLQGSLPTQFFLRARTKHTPTTSCRFRFGLAVAGQGKLYINGTESIDLWTSHPPKTDETPIFNRVSMQRFAEMDVKAGEPIQLELILTNTSLGHAVGTAATLTARLGGFEVFDEDAEIRRAAEIAKNVDCPIVMTGLSMDYEYEGSDRKTLRLPKRTDELIEAVLSANPNAIIVTQSGLPIEMPWVNKAATLLHAWFGGQETGHGLVDILFGSVNPSARLSITFPRVLRETPAFLTFGKADRTIVYGEGVFIGHRYQEKLEHAPLFWFGHGLSFSRFEYSNLVAPTSFEPESVFKISVDVSNSGPYDGSEVVQVYISPLTSSIQRPNRELKAFKKPSISVGATATVEFDLDKYAVSFWSEERSQWKAEEGKYAIIIARSSDPQEEVLRQEFALSKTLWWSGL